MRILHVLSQFEVTGAEAYAATLIEEQVRAGHSAIVVSDTFTLPLRARYIPMPIGVRSYRQRLNNITALVRLIRDESIEIVHAHSRAASWISWFATRITRTPFVSTVHGRQHVHVSSVSFSVYGKDIIAVSSTLKSHLVQDLGLNTRHVTIIPNCISFGSWEEASRPGNHGAHNPIVFIGRLTGPKGDIVRLLLTEVLPRVLRTRQVNFDAYGGIIVPEDIPALAAALNNQHKEPVVQLKGFQKDIPRLLHEAALVIGSGRVVPEAMVLQKPVLAYGESNYEGRMTSEVFERAATTNFGDTGVATAAEIDRIAADILDVFQSPPSSSELARLAEMAKERFGAESVAQLIHRVYERAFARIHSPRSIPVLMYHRVVKRPPSNSSHGIWVTAEQFQAQLESLRLRGLSTITFRDYNDFLLGRQPLPKRPIILTFDDGYDDNYTLAFPLLQKFGHRAVIFAVTDSGRRTNFWDSNEPPAELLSSAQMQELNRHGIEIGSHTVTHPNLTQCAADDISRELTESRNSLEQTLGSEVISFAYPYGALNPSIKPFVEKAGYRFAVAADSGPLEFYQDFFEIRRTQVFPWTSGVGFWKKSFPLYYRYKSLKG